VPKRTRRQDFRVGLAVTTGILMVGLPCAAQQLTNDEISLTVNAQEGSYQVSLHDGQVVLRSRVGAQVDHQWLRSSDYPRHQASESTFEDDLGSGRQVTVGVGNCESSDRIEGCDGACLHAVGFPRRSWRLEHNQCHSLYLLSPPRRSQRDQFFFFGSPIELFQFLFSTKLVNNPLKRADIQKGRA
jgi:hypothetical protein